MADKPHQAILLKGVDHWNAFRDRSNHQAVDLSGLDLAGMNLNGYDLVRANLQNANLRNTQLAHTTLNPLISVTPLLRRRILNTRMLDSVVLMA